MLGSRAADHNQEDVRGSAAHVLDLHVVPQVTFVVPAMLPRTDNIALPGGELRGEDRIPDSQDRVVPAGVVRADLVDGLADCVVRELVREVSPYRDGGEEVVSWLGEYLRRLWEPSCRDEGEVCFCREVG
jgi:hypothetical protein